MSNLEFRSHQSYNERIHDNLVQKIDSIGSSIFLTSVRNTITVVGPTTLNLTADQSGTTVLCQTTGAGDVIINLPLGTGGGVAAPAGTWFHINKDTAADMVIVDSQIPFTGITGRSITGAVVPTFSAQTVTGTAIGDNITIISNGIVWYIVGVASGFL